MAALVTIMLPMLDAALFAAGCMLGAGAPDWMEISWFRRGRNSLIPHRTITHWPWSWLLALIILLLAPVDSRAALPLTGFLVGGLLHLITDFGTPAGLPLWAPFGRRYSLGLYRTGGPGEIIISAALVSSVALWALSALLFF